MVNRSLPPIHAYDTSGPPPLMVKCCPQKGPQRGVPVVTV